MANSDASTPSRENAARLLISALRKTFKSFVDSGRQVIVIGQVPIPPQNAINCIARARFHHQSDALCATVPIDVTAKKEALVAGVLQAAANNNPSIHIFLPHTNLCDAQECRFMADGRPLYMDPVHLSSFGALLATKGLASIAAAALKAQNSETSGD